MHMTIIIMRTESLENVKKLSYVLDRQLAVGKV